MACSSAEKTLELVSMAQAFSRSSSGMTTTHDVELYSVDLELSVYLIRVVLGWSSKRESCLFCFFQSFFFRDGEP